MVAIPIIDLLCNSTHELERGFIFSICEMKYTLRFVKIFPARSQMFFYLCKDIFVGRSLKYTKIYVVIVRWISTCRTVGWFRSPYVVVIRCSSFLGLKIDVHFSNSLHIQRVYQNICLLITWLRSQLQIIDSATYTFILCIFLKRRFVKRKSFTSAENKSCLQNAAFISKCICTAIIKNRLVWFVFFSWSLHYLLLVIEMSKQLFSSKTDNRITTVVATPGYGPDRQVEVQYFDTKVTHSIILLKYKVILKFSFDPCENSVIKLYQYLFCFDSKMHWFFTFWWFG